MIDGTRLRSRDLLGELRVARSDVHGRTTVVSHGQTCVGGAIEIDEFLRDDEAIRAFRKALLSLDVAVVDGLAHGGRSGVLDGSRGVHAVDVVHLLAGKDKVTLGTVVGLHVDFYDFPEARLLVIDGYASSFGLV